MNMQGIMFNGETPMMSGTWYNPKTKDQFTVRNTFFENNQLIVQTMDGRILEYNQLQHYIQSDGPIPTEEPVQKSSNNSLPQEVASLIEGDDMMLPDEMDLISNPLGNLYDKNAVVKSVPEEVLNPPTLVDDNYVNNTIISKALEKHGAPKISVKLDKRGLPKDSIKVLMDVMDISKKEIVQWYMDSINLSQLYDELKETVEKALDEKLKEKD
jgi:hypothetical protein